MELKPACQVRYLTSHGYYGSIHSFRGPHSCLSRDEEINKMWEMCVSLYMCLCVFVCMCICVLSDRKEA